VSRRRETIALLVVLIVLVGLCGYGAWRNDGLWFLFDWASCGGGC
jgi:hypothetical protein